MSTLGGRLSRRQEEQLVLAHSLGAGGPELELLIVAAGLVVLGTVFFLQRSVKPELSVVLVVVGVGFGIGAWTLAPEPVSGRGIDVAIAAPREGDTVPAGKPVRLEASVQGAQLQSMGGGSNAGHLHIFVDDELVAMPVSATPSVTVERGTHEIAVEYVDARHVSLSPRVLDRVTVTAR
jgi:hypothetical protein